MSVHVVSRRSAAVLATIAMLAACSARESASPVATPAAAYLAVARGRVEVEGGPVSLVMPVESVVRGVYVHEGEPVAAGQLVIEGDRTAAGLDVSASTARIQQVDARLHSLQMRAASARIHSHRLSAAATAGAGDVQSADDAAAEASQYEAEAAAARADAAVARTDLTRARRRLQELALRAPVDADVVRVAAHVGVLASPQSGPVAVLLPRASRIVRAQLPEAYADAVAVGDSAEIVTDDDQVHAAGHGRVLRISPMFGVAPSGDDPTSRAGESSVECAVSIEGATRLRVGQRVLVRFPAARRQPSARGRPRS